MYIDELVNQSNRITDISGDGGVELAGTDGEKQCETWKSSPPLPRTESESLLSFSPRNWNRRNSLR